MTKEMMHRIKGFAPINNLLTDEEIKITAEHPYMAVTNPWIDESARFELKNSEAVKTWGLTTVVDFCEKAEKAFQEDGLTYTLIEKIYSLDNDELDTLTKYVHEKWENCDVTLERIIRDYVWCPKKGGASDEVKLIIMKEQPTVEECEQAYNTMYSVLRDLQIP